MQVLTQYFQQIPSVQLKQRLQALKKEILPNIIKTVESSVGICMSGASLETQNQFYTKLNIFLIAYNKEKQPKIMNASTHNLKEHWY